MHGTKGKVGSVREGRYTGQSGMCLTGQLGMLADQNGF